MGGDFSGIAFIDPVVLSDKDIPNAVNLKKTKVRTLFFNDPKSICVTQGWPQFGDKFAGCADLQIKNASECKHMDVLSSWGKLQPLCISNTKKQDACKVLARNDIAAADGF